MTTTYTVAKLVDRTFDLLLGSERQTINQLTSAIDSSQVSFSVRFAPPPKVKDYLTVDTEIMFVTGSASASGTSSTVTVIRAMKGSTAAAHDATAIVNVNPFFSRYQVRATLQDEIRSWGPQVFAVKTVDLSSTDYVRGYDLGAIAPFFGVLDVRESPDAVTANVNDKDWRSVPFDLLQSAPTATFPSGQGLIITSPYGVYDSPRTFHVVYSAPFNVDSTFTDTATVLAMGLDISDVDIPPYGAAWRLGSSREMRRLLTQAMGQVADLQEYPPGYAIRSAQEFKQFRDARLNDAKARLYSQYPLRRTPS